MVSKKRFIIAGLSVDIYGLEEYKEKQRRSRTRVPLAVMIAMHGFDKNMDLMEPMCQTFCSEENPQRLQRRHLIMATFDHVNHGQRYSGTSTAAVEYPHIAKSYFQYSHMWDLMTLIQMATHSVSSLIDSLEYHMFGPESDSFVETWGVAGFSVGGSSAIIAGARDPRVSVVISISGPPQVYTWAQHLIKLTPETEKKYLSHRWSERTASLQHNIEETLCATKVFILTGDKDSFTPPRLLHNFAKTLRPVHHGREGKDWAMEIVPNGRHDMTQTMINLAAQRLHRWLVLEEEEEMPRAKL